MTGNDRGYRRFIGVLVERALRHNPHLLVVNHWLGVREREGGSEDGGRNVRPVYGRKKGKTEEDEG